MASANARTRALEGFKSGETRVLVATDLSPAGNVAVRHGYSLLPGGAALRVIHVCPAPGTGLDPLVADEVEQRRLLEVGVKLHFIASRLYSSILHYKLQLWHRHV